MLYVRFRLSLRNVEDLLHERGVDVSHETIRLWWNRFGAIFAAEIRRNRISRMRILQVFAAVHSSGHNHFNQERHLYTRANVKLNRAAALSEWRKLGVA